MSDDPAIVVRDLSKTYGKVVALRGISFEVSPGSVTGLLGPNGSGKTTTVSILSTALRPDSGEATVLGVDVVGKPREVRRLMGFAGQFAAVDESLTGQENLRLIGRLSRLTHRAARQRAGELLDRFRLTDAGGRLVRTYSGGMRRRLDLAAALMHRPPILFLDEPTTGLDPESRMELWQIVRDLVRDGTTVLLTTQYLEEADALAHDLVIIDDGQVVERGTPHALRQRVGSAVVRLTFGSDADAAEAALALGERYPASREGSTLQLTETGGSSEVMGIARQLAGRAPDPEAVEIREPTLDDVFLSLTGKSGREKEKPVHEAEAVPVGTQPEGAS